MTYIVILHLVARLLSSVTKMNYKYINPRGTILNSGQYKVENITKTFQPMLATKLSNLLQ